jgi:septum site-determining protein MinC
VLCKNERHFKESYDSNTTDSNTHTRLDIKPRPSFPRFHFSDINIEGGIELKLRGVASGLSLLLEPNDTPEGVQIELEKRSNLLSERLEIEVHDRVPFEVIAAVMNVIGAYGGYISHVRSSRTGGSHDPRKNGERRAKDRRKEPLGIITASSHASSHASQRTEIVSKTLRSGTRREVPGSVIVLGDVNPGVELIAGGDVIVVGTLRGLAHAGAQGREDSIIWAQRIASPQLRIGTALARAEDSSFDVTRAKEGDGAEIARVENGQIVIEPYGR